MRADFNKNFTNLMKASHKAGNEQSTNGYRICISNGFLYITIDSERYIRMLNSPYLDAPEWLNVQPFKK